MLSKSIQVLVTRMAEEGELAWERWIWVGKQHRERWIWVGYFHSKAVLPHGTLPTSHCGE